MKGPVKTYVSVRCALIGKGNPRTMRGTPADRESAREDIFRTAGWAGARPALHVEKESSHKILVKS